MKNFTRRLPVKILCFILCVLFLCATVVSAFGAVFIALEGFYTRTEEEILWDAVYRDVSIDANVITFSRLTTASRHWRLFQITKYILCLWIL